MRLLLSTALAAVLAGCAIPQAPVRSDPLAGLAFDKRPPAFPGLTLALIVSENTKDAVRFGQQGAAWGGGFDMDALVEESFRFYKANFKAVIRVEQPADAAQAGADLVAVVDRFVTAGRTFSISAKTLFLDRQGKTLETLETRKEARMSGFSAGPTVARVSGEVAAELERQLRGSAALEAFAQKAGPGKPAAVVEAPAAPRRETLNPSYKESERPQDVAIVVGVAKYSDLPEAQYAEADAEAVAAHLLALGVPQRNLIRLTGMRATRTGLKKYVETWLPNNVRPGSRVFFYFSGHGAPDPRTGEAFLVPFDGDPNYLADTAYPVKELYRSLSAAGAKEVLVALDACFSGAGGRSVLAKGARPLVVTTEAAEPPPAAVTVLAAAAGDQITATLEESGHGLFTHYLLKGLDGAAKDGKGRVTASGLYDYLAPKVQDEARRQNREQTPALRRADGSDFLLRD
ncbi:hypothetical protein EPO15_17565 [bacterium]|nr:MAG: hypothetical protein EPO15_17565 [bacterium]